MMKGKRKKKGKERKRKEKKRKEKKRKEKKREREEKERLKMQEEIPLFSTSSDDHFLQGSTQGLIFLLLIWAWMLE